MSKFEPVSLARQHGYPSDAKNVAVLDSPEGLSLYIDNPCVVDLPTEGEITFRFKRGPATLVEASERGPSRASADFTLFEITNVKEIKTETDSPQHEANEIDKLFEEARREEKDE